MAESVAEVLQQMQLAIKSGNLPEAAVLGKRCVIPLSLTPAQFTMGKVLSEGAESQVLEGKYLSGSVAIKKPFIRTTNDLERFRMELKINALLQHDNIVPIIGARLIPPNYCLLMPLEGVSYYHRLHVEERKMEWREVIRVGMEVSDALIHMHENGIWHRDIKTKNLLEGKNGSSKIIDFGIAQFINHQITQSSIKPTGGFHKDKMLGTLEYMAPEVLQNKGYCGASDVYSFAVCVSEMATGIYPYSDCNKDNPEAHTVLEMGYGRQELAAAVAAEGLRPTLPKDCPVIFSELINACWQLDSIKRPTVHQLNAQFKSMYASFVQLNFPQTIHLSIPKVEMKYEDLSIRSKEVSKDRWTMEIEENKYCPRVYGGMFATAGCRGADRMEDRHLMEPQFQNNLSCSLFGVFDGHRGAEASQYAIDYFSQTLNQNLKKSDSIKNALHKTFLCLEQAFESTIKSRIEEPRGTRYPGCTALVSFLVQDHLYLANAGDCRGVLCSNGEAFQLTRDHTAADSLERCRIQCTGTRITWQKGSWRIGNAGIQVTRSLGDIDLKPDIVVSEPEISSYILTSNDEFLILATDGLWDTLTNEEAVALVQDTVKNPDMCAKRLAMEALTRGSQDNITVLVVFLKPVSSLEQIFINGNLKYRKHYPKKTILTAAIAADEIRETL